MFNRIEDVPKLIIEYLLAVAQCDASELNIDDVNTFLQLLEEAN